VIAGGQPSHGAAQPGGYRAGPLAQILPEDGNGKLLGFLIVFHKNTTFQK
jgi:hypothetical protein